MSLVIPADTIPPKSRSRLRRWVWVLGLCFLLSAFCFVFRSSLLIGLANAWVVDEPGPKADAIVVLGGGIENRPFAAAKLFHEGVAPRILYMDVQPGPVEELGLVLPEAEQTRRILLSNNVPVTALTAIGKQVASTYDESCAVRDWAKTSGARTILIPTDLFHTRRVRWLFQKQLTGTGATVKVAIAERRDYTATNWWQTEQGLISFQNEWIKLAYYHLKY